MRDEVKAGAGGQVPGAGKRKRVGFSLNRPPAPDTRHPFSFRLFLLFVLLSLVAYSPVINSYFLSDDFVQVGRVLQGDWSMTWGRETGGFFRPMFVLSYVVDAFLWRENPFGYHLSNTLLHAASATLVYSLARRLLLKQKVSAERAGGAALVAGLLFLLHPSHTEAVSWIAGRADLLATTLSMTAMLAFISFMETRRILVLILSLLAFALALLAKEAVASLPLILFALGIYFAHAGNRKLVLIEAFKMSVPFFAILLLFIIVRRMVLGAWVGGYGAGQHLNFSPVWIESRFLQATLRALVPALPHSLSPIFLKPLQSPIFIVSILVCASLLILLLRRRRRLAAVIVRREENRLVLLLIAAFVLSLLPVINLRLSLFDTQGERFVYWPTVFTCIFVPYLALVLLRSTRWCIALMLCVLVFYSVSLYRTNQTWREAASIARSVKDELARDASQGKGLIVINAPDNLRGVPIFHNGLEDALRLFQKEKRIEMVRVLALHGMRSRNFEVELKREEGAFTLRLPVNADGFTKVVDWLDCLKVLEHERGRVRFQLGDCAKSSDIFFFNAGRMYRVLDAEGVPP